MLLFSNEPTVLIKFNTIYDEGMKLPYSIFQ